ncbi:MAG: SHOCT domain-containing protein [Limisphaerales bacterium]
MKKLFIPALIALSSMLLLTGCLNLSFGGGAKSQVQKPTIGQQLIDLQKARATGAISDSEYQAQKTKLLENK